MPFRTFTRKAAGPALLTIAGWIAGCNGSDDHQTAAQAAQDALNIEGAGNTQRSVEAQRDVDVIETTKVVDRKTGEVITTKQEVTPVTVQVTKEVETKVQEGKPTQTVK